MKASRLVCILLIFNSLGCKKETPVPQVEALFNQQFTVGYLQSAYLPTQAAPELAVSLDDITDTRCPTNVTCLLAGNVQATVGIRGQSGTKQVVTLCLECGPTTGLLDSAVVQANSRRYVLRMQRVTPVAAAAKSDYRVEMIVRR